MEIKVTERNELKETMEALGNAKAELVKVDGLNLGIGVASSEKDRENMQRVIQAVTDIADGDPAEIMNILTATAICSEKGITPSDLIVAGEEAGIPTHVVLDYVDGKAYVLKPDGETETLADISNLLPLDDEVQKRLLTAEAEKAFEELIK